MVTFSEVMEDLTYIKSKIVINSNVIVKEKCIFEASTIDSVHVLTKGLKMF